jgi:hypothetical protein
MSAQDQDDEAARLAGEAATLARRILAQTAR